MWPPWSRSKQPLVKTTFLPWAWRWDTSSLNSTRVQDLVLQAGYPRGPTPAPAPPGRWGRCPPCPPPRRRRRWPVWRPGPDPPLGQTQGHDRRHRVRRPRRRRRPPGPGWVWRVSGASPGKQQHALGTQGDEQVIQGEALPEPGPARTRSSRRARELPHGQFGFLAVGGDHRGPGIAGVIRALGVHHHGDPCRRPRAMSSLSTAGVRTPLA